MNNNTHTREEMIEHLKAHLNSNYKVIEYSDEYLPVRVPLYGESKNNNEPDIVVDLTLSTTISKRIFLPDQKIDSVQVHDAGSLTFYQHYFIQAGVYLAYYEDIEKSDEFCQFKAFCQSKGIGLLEVAKNGTVHREIEARSLFDEICNKFGIVGKTRKEMEYYLRNFLHYFVYYPKPIFRRRAITGRTEGDISFILIDKLCELKNICYRKSLIKLSSEYRREARDDYQIALETIKELWEKVCKVEYPEVQRQLEDILLRNSEYRDHFLHQFQVFLLGAYIIDELYNAHEKCIVNFKKEYGCEIEKAWLLVATYHDFNYSIQRYHLWSKEFFSQSLNTTGDISSLKLDAAFVRENFLLKTRELCEALNLKMDHTVTIFFYEQVINKRNHGLLSALSLLKLFENSKKRNKTKRTVQVQASVAIALHDYDIWGAFSNVGIAAAQEKWYSDFAKKKFLGNLAFSKYPLVFLLIFCDTVQEWGRVGKNYHESKPRLENLEVKPNHIKVSISVAGNGDTSYDDKEKEIKQVKKFLKDARFVISLTSRKGGSSSETQMQGT